MAVEIPGYANLTEIGRGGFAVVYKADQQGFGRTVAVKVLARHNVDDRTRRRFSHECEVMGALSWHPNIVVIYDSGLTQEGQPFLAMEYLADGSVADQCERTGHVAEADVIRWGVEVAGALQTAHDAGVLHRDIKPDNILLDVFGQAKLADFGIAGVAGSGETTRGAAAFTVVHAAPEVLNGLPATPLSDVYSLGSALFELLAGQPAFRRDTDESVAATLLRVVQEPPPDLRLRGIGDDLASLVESMMAKAPEDRPPSAAAVGEALRAIEAAQGRPMTDLRLHPDRARAAANAGVAPSAPSGGRSEPTFDREDTIIVEGAGMATVLEPIEAPEVGPDPPATSEGPPLREDAAGADLDPGPRADPDPGPDPGSGSGAGLGPAVGPVIPTSPPPPIETHRRRRLPLVVGAIAIVAVVVGVVFVAGRGDDETTQPLSQGVVAATTVQPTTTPTSISTTTSTANPQAFCESLALIAKADRRAQRRTDGVTEWSELQPLIVQGSEEAADLYTDAAAKAPDELVDRLTLIAEVTRQLASVAAASPTPEAFQRDGQRVDNFAEAQTAIAGLNGFTSANCGFDFAQN